VKVYKNEELVGSATGDNCDGSTTEYVEVTVQIAGNKLEVI